MYIITAIYCTAARCYDNLESYESARNCYVTAVNIDPSCLEALEEIRAQCPLNIGQRARLLEGVDFRGGREWLYEHYRYGVYRVSCRNDYIADTHSVYIYYHMISVYVCVFDL